MSAFFIARSSGGRACVEPVGVRGARHAGELEREARLHPAVDAGEREIHDADLVVDLRLRDVADHAVG